MSAKLGFLLSVSAAALLMTSAPETARAGAEERETAIANLLGRLGDAIRWTKPSSSYSGDEVKEMRERCREAIVEAKAEGVRGSDDVAGWGDTFKVHPKAKKSGDGYVVKFADVGWFCDDLDLRLDYWDMVKQLENGLDAQRRIPEPLTEDKKKHVEGHEVEYWYDANKRCTAAVAKQIERGVDPNKEIELKDGKKVKPADAAPICAALSEYAAILEVAFKERFAELAKKYEAVGIKGKRLEIFVYYDPMEWYLKGCKSSTNDPKKMKKAKAMFHWLTDSYGVITIRKYAFKGDTYKVTEKQYLTEAKAYKGCK